MSQLIRGIIGSFWLDFNRAMSQRNQSLKFSAISGEKMTSKVGKKTGRAVLGRVARIALKTSLLGAAAIFNSQGVALAENPYTDAVNEQYLQRAEANDLPALVRGALSTMVVGSSTEEDTTSAAGAGAAVKSQDLDEDGINTKSDSGIGTPARAKRPIDLKNQGRFESQTGKWGPYVALNSVSNNQKLNALFNRDSNFGVLTQTNIAMCLANAAVCQGRAHTVEMGGAFLEASRGYRADYEEMIKRNPRAKPKFEKCLTDAIKNTPSATLEDIYALCMGDSYKEGQGVSNRATVNFERGWDYNNDQGGNVSGALVSAATLKNLKSTDTVAAVNYCSGEPNARADLLSYAIYNPAVEYLKRNAGNRLSAADQRKALEVLLAAWNEFVALYGDAKYVQESVTAPGSSTPTSIVKLSEEIVKPYVCNGTTLVQKNSFDDRRKQFAISAVKALLRRGESNASEEAKKPGLVVERCERVNRADGPFTSVRANVNNNFVSEFCNPNDNSQVERRAAVSFGDYMFGQQHCEVVWEIAKSWLESIKGSENKTSGLIEYKCDELVKIGEQLVKEFETGVPSRTIEVANEKLRKPDFMIYAALWARAKAHWATEIDLPAKIIKHISSILVSSDPTQQALKDLVGEHVYNIHKGFEQNKDQVLLAFAEYSKQTEESVKNNQYRGSMITYGGGGSPNVRKGDNS